MNWKPKKEGWNLHFTMTFSKIPGKPDHLMSEVVTRAPIRKKIVPLPLYRETMEKGGAVADDYLKQRAGVLSQYRFIIDLFRKKADAMRSSSPDERENRLWAEMVWDTSAAYPIPGEKETLWMRPGTLARSSDYGTFLIVGEIFSVNPFLGNEKPQTGFVPILVLDSEGPKEFKAVVCSPNQEISLITKEEWMSLSERWTDTDCKYLNNTLMTVRLPF